MDEVLRVQSAADDTDSAVHHVRRRHDVGTGFGLRHRLLHEHFDRFVVEDVARFVDETVLTVRGVGIQGDVAHDAEIGTGGFDCLHRTGNEALGIGGFDAVRRLEIVFDVREESYHRNPEFHHLFAFGDEFIHGVAHHARHRRNRFTIVLAFFDEHGEDEIVGGEHVFAHQTAGKIVVTHAAHAFHRVLTESLHFDIP